MAPRRGGDESAPLRGRPFPCIVPPCTYSSHVKGGVLEVERTKSGKVRRVLLPPALAAEIRTRVARLVPFVHHGQFAQTVKRLSGVVGSHVHRTRHDWAIQWLADGGSHAAVGPLDHRDDDALPTHY